MATGQKNEKKNSKFRFNAVDAFIILVVVMCIVGIYFRGNIESWLGSKKDLADYQITVVVEKVKSTSGEFIGTGDEIYISKNIALGKVSAISSFPAKEYVSDGDGNIIEVRYPENTYIDLTITVDCRGIKNDDGFYLDGTYLVSPGTKMAATTEIMDFSFTVISITEKTE
jgi:hypothetical protein